MNHFTILNQESPKHSARKKKHFRNVQLTRVQKGVPLKPAKITDVKRLLTLHFGDEWYQKPRLQFFKDLFAEQPMALVPLIPENGEEEEIDFELMEDDGLEIR